MKILFYGRLADLVGREIDIEVSRSCSIAELRERLIADHPSAQDTLLNSRVRACVAGALVDDRYEVGATDRVEFLAPVSGG